MKCIVTFRMALDIDSGANLVQKGRNGNATREKYSRQGRLVLRRVPVLLYDHGCRGRSFVNQPDKYLCAQIHSGQDNLSPVNICADHHGNHFPGCLHPGGLFDL